MVYPHGEAMLFVLQAPKPLVHGSMLCPRRTIFTITGRSAHAPNVLVNGPYTLTAWVQQGSGLVDYPREWPGLGSNGRTAASEQVLRGSDRAW